MDFLNYKCPVCEQQFKSGDDIVVCPECGTPHHRECYENTGHCFYEDKHSEDFSFDENTEHKTDENPDGTVTCPKCNHINDDTTFYCEKCGYPLNEQDRKNQQANNVNTENNPFGQNNNMPPFGFGGPTIQFDPLAGLKSDDEIADNVKVGEMAKFVGKTTQYYLLVFNRIKKLGSSKFNFSAFIFSGFYFLYRKMTVIGILASLIFIGLTVGETFIQLMPEYQELFTTLYNLQAEAHSFYSIPLTEHFTSSELLFLFSPLVLAFFKGILMIVCGLTANRSYYKHCSKKINKIKKSANDTNLNKELETNGGVNLPIAACFVVAYMIVTYIPLFL